jgi:lysophospholipase L1-like esterase
MYWQKVSISLAAILACALMWASGYEFERDSKKTCHSLTQVDVTSSRLSVVGDSITAGWTLDDPGKEGFPARLRDRLWGRMGSLTVDAIGGRCLLAATCATGNETIYSRFQNMTLGATPKPTTVFVEAGINDLGRVSTSQLEAAYAQLKVWSDAASVKLVVATITPQESSRWPTWWNWGPQMLEVNAWLRAAFGADCADFYGSIVYSGGGNGNGWMVPAYGSGDGGHPNWIGHVRMADSVNLNSVV